MVRSDERRPLQLVGRVRDQPLQRSGVRRHSLTVSSESELIPEGLMIRVAERLRILGQPVRLRLIELLTEGPSTPHELSDALGLSQQNVSKHLLSLHRAGVVSRRPDGGSVFYALADPSAVPILRLSVDAVSDHLS